MAKPDQSHQPPAREPTAVAWDRRGLLLCAAAALLGITVFGYAGSAWPIVLTQLLMDGLVLLLWLAAGAGWGAAALALLRRVDLDAARGALALVTAVATGLGLMSLATLGLGLAGALTRAAAFTLLAGGIAAGSIVVWPRWGTSFGGDLGPPLRQWLARPAMWHWLWLTTLPLLGVALVAACVPPGLLWNPDEPHGYDVVAYHFQVPREWFEVGRIVPLRHNVFSYFPFAVEMHYLLAMHLCGGPWKGMYLAQLMHVAHVAMTVLAVYGSASSLTARPPVALIAALLCAAAPWLTLLAPVGYNEGGLLLYGALAVAWTLRAADAPSRVSLARFALAGAMAGFACGVKLTAVPMLLAGVPVATAVAFPRRLPHAIVYVVVGGALFAPWAVRNVAWTGNPVFPEAMRLLGRAHFSDTQVQRWERAHSPRPDQKPIPARARAAATEVLFDWRFGYVTAVGVVAIALGFRDPRRRLLCVLLLLLAVFWLSLTHLQGRFFVLAVPILAMLVALTDWRGLAAPVVALAGAWAIGCWLMVHVRFAQRLHGNQSITAVIGLTDFSALHPREVNALPPGATLVLIGEAKAFLYQHPMTALRYRTVFDVDVAAGQDSISAWRGRATREPGEWELVHPSELQRFANTYWGIPQPPPELKGREDLIVVPSAQ